MERPKFLGLIAAAGAAMLAPFHKVEASKIIATPQVLTNIKDSVPYRCLLVDPLPSASRPVYLKDANRPVTLFRADENPVMVFMGNDFVVPLFDLRNHNVNLNQAFARILDTAVPSDQIVSNLSEFDVVMGNGFPILGYINGAFAKLEPKRFTASKILAGSEVINRLGSELAPKYIDVISREEAHALGMPDLKYRFRLWTAGVYDGSEYLKPNEAFVLAPPEFLGVLPKRSEHEIGMAVANPQGVSKIVI